MSSTELEEKSFEDNLADAFKIAGRAALARDRKDAFQRVGRFQLQSFKLGDSSAVAEITYFPSGAETMTRLTNWESLTMSWELDQLRLLICEMPDGEERSYLAIVEEALAAYSWLQWAVQDTGENMRPEGDLGEIGHRTKSIMQTLQAIRNPRALFPERRPSL